MDLKLTMFKLLLMEKADTYHLRPNIILGSQKGLRSTLV